MNIILYFIIFYYKQIAKNPLYGWGILLLPPNYVSCDDSKVNKHQWEVSAHDPLVDIALTQFGNIHKKRQYHRKMYLPYPSATSKIVTQDLF